MPDRENPVSTKVLGNLRLGRDDSTEKAFISSMVERALSWDRERAGWIDHQRLLTRLRHGIRKAKTFPWPNASNLAIPFVDHCIRKYKPTLFRLITEPDPICEFVGADPAAVEAERLAETVYNWVFKTLMETSLTECAYLIDNRCHRGFSFLQVGWDYAIELETRTVPIREFFPEGIPPGQDIEELKAFLADQYGIYPDDARNQETLNGAIRAIQEGRERVKLTYRKVVRDRPAIWWRDPIQVLVPPRTTEPENAERIIIQHVFSLRQLRNKEAEGFFIKGSCDEIKRYLDNQRDNPQGGATDDVDINLSRSLYLERQLENERDKIFGVENEDNILIWECMHWYDHNNDGLDERVVTYIHPRTRIKFRSSPYSAPFPQWPLVKFDFEKVARRWHAPRGISALLRDLQMEINAQHNLRIDGMTLSNAPAWQIPTLAAFKTRNFRVAPGTVIETPSGAQLTPLIHDRGAFPEMVQEENLLRSIGENYIGIFDAAITSPQSNVKSRTATEISAVVQYTAATSTFDAVLFQQDMKKVHEMIWQLFLELGPPEIKIKVLGLDPQSPEAQFMTIKKTDINKKFRLYPTGTVANTNRALELQNARETVAMYINDQSGFINPHELRKWHISLLAQPRIARRLVNSPDQAAELVTLQQAAAALEKEPELMDALRGGTPVEPPEREQQEIGRSAQAGILSGGELNGRQY